MNNDNIYKSGLGDGWKTLQKSAENDPELKNELNDIELQDLKRHDYRHNPKTQKWENTYGESISGSEAYRERHIIRLKAQKFIKDKNQLDKFMRAPNYEAFKKGIFEKGLDKVKEPETKLLEKKTNAEFIIPYSKPLMTFSEKEKLKMELAEIQFNQLLRPKLDPDLHKGIGALIDHVHMDSNPNNFKQTRKDEKYDKTNKEKGE